MLKRNRIKKLLITFIIVIFIIAILYCLYDKETYNNYTLENEVNHISENNDKENYPEIEDLEKAEFENKYISFIAVGDFLLDRNVGNRMKEINDYYFPIRNTKHILESADLTFCNVECPICEGRKIGITETSFRADPETVETLLYGGFDIVSLANNHTMNFGGDCLTKTFDYLNDAGIDYVGAGNNFEDSHKPLIKKVNGITLALLAYNDSDVVPSYYFSTDESPGTNEMDIEQLEKDIKSIQNGNFGDVDLIILSMHSGTEYTPIPNSRQIAFAQSAVDFGVDIVLGHHPHHVQHIEQYKGKYIIYSMGNFVLDQMRWPDCTKELLLNLAISENEIIEVEVIPVRMKNFCETNIAVGYEKEEILEIINYETEEQPYIYFDDEYKISNRNILVNTKIDFNSQKPIKSYNKLDWVISPDQILETIIYNGIIYVLEQNNIVWTSQENIIISDFETGDFNNDKENELAISYWKNENDQLINKITLFKYLNHNIESIWEKEMPENPIIDIEIKDLDEDNKYEMILIEGTYQDFDANKYIGKSITIWQLENNDLSTKFFRSDINDFTNMWLSRNMIYLTLAND